MTDKSQFRKEADVLCRKWLKGDNDSFGKLYDMYIDNLYRFIYFKVSNEEEAEDIVELTFLKAFQAKSKLNLKKSSFGTWLYTIARNTIIDFYRTKKDVEELSEFEVGQTESDVIEMTENSLTSAILKRAINTLNENYRDIVIFRFIEDMSYKEIADVLGKKEGAVRVNQYRAIKELKKVIEAMGFEYEDF